MEKPKAIVLDLDGTITDHQKIDGYITMKNFGNNRLVMFIHKLAWNINSYDFLSNNVNKWKILMCIYCICTFKSFRKELEKYRRAYACATSLEIEAQYESNLKMLEKYGYKIFILSNNPCSKGIDVSYSAISLITSKSKSDEIAKLKEMYDIRYFLGNNYRDDIQVARKRDILPFYIGKSKLLEFLLKTEKRACCLSKAVDQILFSEGVVKGMGM